MSSNIRSTLTLITLLGLVPLSATPQQAPDVQPAAASSPSVAILSNEQLEQLVAPVALYPDSLLGPILMGSTYPLEIVQARRWLDEPANAALKGDALTAALEQMRWDMSIKSLVASPLVLRMMDSHLDWTERMGDAFLAQQDAVMDAVQRLRQRAASAGSLHSTPQQVVTTENQDISIASADPGVIYVPYYDPMLVYGAWPWIGYPPFFFTAYGPGPWPEYPDFVGGLVIGFGIGFPVFGPWWGWNYWDWHHHHVYQRGGREGLRAGPWEHDPHHRHGVPYGNAAVAAHFEDRSEAARREARGYEPARQPGTAVRPTEVPRGSSPRSEASPRACESFGSGPRVHQESVRGASSRSGAAVHSAPSSNGGASRRR
jgi:hypothetical protein